MNSFMIPALMLVAVIVKGIATYFFQMNQQGLGLPCCEKVSGSSVFFGSKDAVQ